MIWSSSDWAALAALTLDRPDYPGNATARGVVEAPGGDPGARDVGKRYSHVATKYLLQTPNWQDYVPFFARADKQAFDLARELGVPPRFLPDSRYSTLRILEYPAGVGASHVHADISLFTVNLYRSTPNPGLGGNPYHMGRIGELVGLGPAEEHWVEPLDEVQRAIVYFAIPAHTSTLPSGESVGEWLERELKGMRYKV